MDGMTLEPPLFLLATFACATPLQAGKLIIAFGLHVKGYSVRKTAISAHYRVNPLLNFNQLHLSGIAAR